jgi:hypothetical protein
MKKAVAAVELQDTGQYATMNPGVNMDQPGVMSNAKPRKKATKSKEEVSPPEEVMKSSDNASKIAEKSMLFIGCAIWAYDGWANSFFPPGTAKDARLNAYSRRLTAVEVNSTFYAVPPLSTVKRWADETPDYFRFSPKFPKAITHNHPHSAAKRSTRTDSLVHWCGACAWIAPGAVDVTTAAKFWPGSPLHAA